MLKSIKTYCKTLYKNLDIFDFFLVTFCIFALTAALISSYALVCISIAIFKYYINGGKDIVFFISLLIIGVIFIILFIITFKKLVSMIIDNIKEINKKYYHIRCQQTKQQCSMIKSYEIPQIQLSYKLKD